MLSPDQDSASPDFFARQTSLTATNSGDAAVAAANSLSLLAEDLEDAPFWKEVVAFARFAPSELERYHGQFIAVYGGCIVDSDADEAELALRFYRVFGYVPVYIHAVGVEDDVIDLYE